MNDASGSDARDDAGPADTGAAGSAGLPITPTSTDAGSRFEAMVESYLGSRADTPLLVRDTMAADPDHLMAATIMGYLTRLAGDPANAGRARALHRDLAGRVAAGSGTAWERDHVTALGLWLDDRLHTLMAHFEAMLDAHPADVLALRMLHYLYFYDGDAVRMRDSVRSRLPAYAGHPLEAYVLGMLAFGHEEAGDYAEAERRGRAAVAANPRDVWAAHAVAHVMEMQERRGEGVAWIQALRPQWHAANNFRFHLDWHEALFHLGSGDFDAVLDLYDTSVGPATADDFYLDLCNAASLLLRIEAAGGAVGERWQPLAEIAERHVTDTELVFASLHYLMPLLRTGHPAAATLLDTLEHWAARDTTQGRVVQDVALEVARFLAARERGDRPAAAAAHQRFRGALHRIGGSHAQRALFDVLHAAA